MAEQAAKKIVSAQAKPILKWAGGKTQMLGDLLPKVPTSFGRYIEPFFGGGAMFFALQPENAVIADSNPELINMYREVADHVEDVIQCLKQYENTSEMFYAVRSQEWTTLPKAEAAARTIFLNRTCFNGLYRVNKQGQFNVPYGKYKNPKITAIAQKKPYMQFIFATHNANIPVLGDSERVLVVEFQESRIDVAQGNIDLDSTHKQIVDIMEGGKEAFDKRQLIYTSWR